METTMISNEAYAKIVNLIKTFYMQGFEDAANCPEPLDMSEDIQTQLHTAGIGSKRTYTYEEQEMLYKAIAQQALDNPEDYGLVDDGRLSEEEEFEYDSYCPPDLDTIDYVLASTSYTVDETYLFAANANGEVIHYGEIGAKAERWGDEDWRDVNAVMEQTFGDQAKHFKVIKEMWGAGPQYLFQRIKGDE